MRRWKLFMPLLGLVVVLALAGCSASSVQGTKYTAFKTATVALAQDAQTNYAEVETLWENVHLQCVVKDNKSYSRILTNLPVECGDGTFEDPKPRLDARLKALSFLVKYATALHTLATTDYTAGIDSSTAKLTESLTSLHEALGKVTKLQDKDEIESGVTLLGQIVKSVGAYYVEGQREKALREALKKETREYIKLLCTKLIHDGNVVAGLSDSASQYYLGEALNHRPKEYSQRLAYDTKALALYKLGQALKPKLKDMDKAIAMLPEAQADLATSLDAPKTPLQNLEAFMAAVEQAVAVAQQIKNL